MNTPAEQTLLKRTGTIRNYKVTRAEANFVFTDTDKTKLGVVAVAAGFAGLAGQAIATASYAASTEEAADYVEFDLDGTTVKGWVWRSPFKEGDQVEVAGEMEGGYLNAAAIARPADRIVALYPHCSRGRTTHITNAAKWWFIGSAGFNLGIVISDFFVAGSIDGLVSDLKGEFGDVLLIGSGCVFAFFALMTISLTRKWMPFVRVAEKVFRTLGWKNPGSVNLVKSSKRQRRPDDPGEYGAFYFRY